jgi:hypothetical protein
METIMLTINELAIALPQSIILELSDSDIAQAWTSAQTYSYDGAKWTAYLNRLSLNALLPWLESLGKVQTDKDFDQIWEFVNGTRLFLDDKQIAIIPNNTDIEEFCVPQEWIDIPTLSADYYLAVQVNPDDRYLRVWGFASHAQLKSSGQFNRYTRSYVLEQDEVLTELSAFEVCLELVTETTEIKAAIAPVSPLSSHDAEKLISHLARLSLYSPRLDVPFEQWGALMANPVWRQQLYTQRIDQAQTQQEVIRSVVPAAANLNQWFEDVFEAGWQTIDRLFPPGSPTFALAFRNGRGATSPGIQRGKVIDLGIKLAGHSVALIVNLKQEPSQTKFIVLRVHPMGNSTHLPKGLKLVLLNEFNINECEAEARDADDYIQIQFEANPGAHFSAKIFLAEASITTEKFVMPFN